MVQAFKLSSLLMLNLTNYEYEFKKFIKEFQLKIASNEGIWRQPIQYQKEFLHLPFMGFKIHLSFATDEFIKRGLPLIQEMIKEKLAFKVVSSISELRSINSGRYGLTQTGKALTIYTKDKKNFIDVVNWLEARTGDIRGPNIPSDKKYSHRHNIYYRYGTFFESSEMKDQLTEPQQQYLENERRPGEAIPTFVDDPFSDIVDDKLPPNLIFLNCIRQRAKGGLYTGLYVNTKENVIQSCIIKEARDWTEEDSNGSFSTDRLRNEKFTSERLSYFSFIPSTLDFFELEGCSYSKIFTADS